MRDVTLPYPHDAVVRQVWAEPTTLLGASTALVLQVAHPSIASAVATHSRYASAPWRRLAGTLDTITKLVFGDAQMVEAMRHRLERRHATIQGTTRTGTPYTADDPALGLWVWATLATTALEVHDRIHDPLTAARRERYVTEAAALAAALGVPRDEVPATAGELASYVERVVTDELAWTRELADIATALFDLQRPVVLGSAVGRLNRMTASWLLPAPVRRMLALPPAGWRASVLTAAGRASRVLPASLRTIGVPLIVDHDLLGRLERLLGRQQDRHG